MMILHLLGQLRLIIFVGVSFLTIANKDAYPSDFNLKHLHDTLPRNGSSSVLPPVSLDWNQLGEKREEGMLPFWRQTYRRPEASSFLAIHFSDISDNAGMRWRIKIKKGEADLQVVDDRMLHDSNNWVSFWSKHALNSDITVEVWAEETPTGLSFTIDKQMYEKKEIAPKSYMDPAHPKIIDIVTYKGVEQYYSPGRAIAKLTINDANESYPCTGFLVGKSILLTNSHCLPVNVSACPNILAEFGFETGSIGSEVIECVKLLKSSDDLDYALLKLRGEPGVKWGYLTLLANEESNGTNTMFVIQHPAGKVKHIAIQQCQAIMNSADSNVEFWHTCDTEGGSSGSPVFDEGNNVVGIHHAGFAESAPKDIRFNRAIASRAIRADIEEEIRR